MHRERCYYINNEYLCRNVNHKKQRKILVGYFAVLRVPRQFKLLKRGMTMLQLYFDSDMDVTPELAERYKAKLISMPYTVKGKLIYPYVDFDEFDVHGFYDMLRAGEMPTTSALNVWEYKDIFKADFEEGNDILYVHFSAAMTRTFDSMHAAVEELEAQYPATRFYSVDTKGITVCSYRLANLAGEMYLEGKSAEEIVAAVENEREHTATYFYADNLDFFRRSGRVGNLAAFMGNIFGVKPILNMNSDGVMTAVKKVCGTTRALDGITEYVASLGDDIANTKVYVAHSDCFALAQRLANALKAKFGDLDIEFVGVNPTAGSHCGPDCVGVTFHAVHR